MKTYIHGTDYESAQNILANGLLTDKDTIWTCSDCDMLYVRDMDDEDDDNTLDLCIESGQLAAAYKDSKDTRIGVIRIEMDDDIAEQIVETDDSCENTWGCYQIMIDDLNDLLEAGKIRMHVDIYEDSYVPYLRVFYLSCAPKTYLDFNDDLLVRALDMVNKASIFIDEILCHGDLVDTSEYVIHRKEAA